MSTIASLQVRMGSGRLPGKTMLDLAGKPLLERLLDRLALVRGLDGVVVATATGSENDVIESFCKDRGVACFRGSENDVLDRMLGALAMVNATIAVEVFGDSPLIDPAIVDHMIGVYMDAKGSLDFVGNDLKTTYPPGMIVEVVKMSALADSATRTADPAIREHGTLFVRQHPELYNLLNIDAPEEFRRPELELEVDTPEDVPVVSAVFDHFGARADFGLAEIIAFMDAHPELRRLNADVPRRWKQYRA